MDIKRLQQRHTGLYTLESACHACARLHSLSRPQQASMLGKHLRVRTTGVGGMHM